MKSSNMQSRDAGSSVVEVGTQSTSSTGVFQAADGLFLDLADTLPCKVEFAPDLFQGMGLVTT